MRDLDYLNLMNMNAGTYSEWEVIRIEADLKKKVDGQRLIGYTQRTIDLPTLEDTIELYAGNQPRMVGIGGGDGTAAHTLSLIKEKWGQIPMIIPYSFGTMNNWSLAVSANDPISDKVKKKLRIGNTKAMQLAKYIASIPREATISIQELALLDINGKKGFNVGLGLVPKILWKYYGKTNYNYLLLEDKISSHKENEEFMSLSVRERERIYQDIFESFFKIGEKKGGMSSIGKTAAISIYEVFKKPILTTRFYAQPLEGKFYVDGKEFKTPNDEPIISVYISTYEQVNFGVKYLWPRLCPDVRDVKDKMQVIISWDHPLTLPAQILGMFKRDQLKNSIRVLASEFAYVPKNPTVSQIDGDISILDQEVSIKYDQTLDIISPFRPIHEKL